MPPHLQPFSRPAPPKKPYPTFPLWPHKSGSWVAVVDGVRRSFGGWRKDPKGDFALGEYEKYVAARQRGLPPILADQSTTLREVINHYLDRQRQRAETGGITHRNHGDAVRVLTRFAKQVGPGRRIIDLRAATFRHYRASLNDFAPPTIARHIRHIKAAFRWAFDEEIVVAPPRYGADFKPPRPSVRQAKQFTADEIRAMLAKATLPLRAMIRLGIECGFGNTDCAALLWEEVDLDRRFIQLIEGRHKTNARRRCAISPALVADLKTWREVQAKREVPIAVPGAVFSTLTGQRYVREIPSADPRTPPRLVDAIATAFGKLRREKLKMKTDGRSFYTLRRTHRTWADELRDHHASALVMGHKTGEVASLYVQSVDDARLLLILNHVLARLKRTESPQPKVGGDRPVAKASAAAAPRTKRGRHGRFSKSSGRSNRSRR
jgi:integrase